MISDVFGREANALFDDGRAAFITLQCQRAIFLISCAAACILIFIIPWRRAYQFMPALRHDDDLRALPRHAISDVLL